MVYIAMLGVPFRCEDKSWVRGIHFILRYKFLKVQYVIVEPYFVVKANHLPPFLIISFTLQSSITHLQRCANLSVGDPFFVLFSRHVGHPCKTFC